MLKKKYVPELKMPAPKSAEAPEMDAAEDEEMAPEEEDLFADDESDDEEGEEMESACASASDEEILAEARKRGLTLGAPAKKSDDEAEEVL